MAAQWLLIRTAGSTANRPTTKVVLAVPKAVLPEGREPGNPQSAAARAADASAVPAGRPWNLDISGDTHPSAGENGKEGTS